MGKETVSRGEVKMVTRYFRRALSYVLDEMGPGSQSELARRIKKRQSYISMLASGQKEGTEQTRREIARALGYPYEKFLRLGKLLFEKKNINLSDFDRPINVDTGQNSGYLPHHNLDDTGAEPQKITVYSSRNLHIIKGLPMGKVVDYVSCVPSVRNDSRNLFGVRIGEENMVPYLWPGMIAVIDPQAACEHGKLCFCTDENKIYRYFRHGDSIILRSDSKLERYPDLEYSEDTSPELYRVIETIRKE
jgi:transcriptional regulator with XRE-family HTH domain